MHQYASIPGVIRTFLIILLIYLGFKILARLFAPFIMRYVAKKAGKQFEQRYGQYQRPQDANRKEGEVSIDKEPMKGKSSSNDVGEYVDYEEID